VGAGGDEERKVGGEGVKRKGGKRIGLKIYTVIN